MLLYLILFLVDPQKPSTPGKAPIVLRDARGRVTSTFTPKGPSLIVRDTKGRLQGSITLRGTGAVVRDSRGRVK